MPVISAMFSLRASSMSCGHRHFLQLGDVDIAALLDGLVVLVDDVAGADFFGNFFGQGKRFAFGFQLRFDFVERGLERIAVGRAAGMGRLAGTLRAGLSCA